MNKFDIATEVRDGLVRQLVEAVEANDIDEYQRLHELVLAQMRLVERLAEGKDVETRYTLEERGLVRWDRIGEDDATEEVVVPSGGVSTVLEAILSRAEADQKFRSGDIASEVSGAVERADERVEHVIDALVSAEMVELHGRGWMSIPGDEVELDRESFADELQRRLEQMRREGRRRGEADGEE